MDDRAFTRLLTRTRQKVPSSLKLGNGSRVAVIGGGPAGSFFSYFLLDMAERVGLQIQVDIYEPRDFTVPGPAGCNMCGGVIYESLVQSLAVEGINLPTSVVQRGIEYNMLHLEAGSVQIRTPRREKRIATTFRGIGPRGVGESRGISLDSFLIRSALAKGARQIFGRVTEVSWHGDEQAGRRVQLRTQAGTAVAYDLTAVTSGVNTAVLELFSALDFGYEPPQTRKLMVREYRLGEEVVSKYVGPVFHAFLLDIPGLDYGAIIPKGDYVTVCLLSSHGNLDPKAMDTFLSREAVQRVLPPGVSPAEYACYCGPRINVSGSRQPFGDRIVFIGDSGVSRLYKDGIGAAYRAAKIAASTAVFQGISSADFRRYYLPFCRRMDFDNQVGKLLFRIIGQVQKMPRARRTILGMVANEQRRPAVPEHGMSAVIWDMLTGGAPFGDVLARALRPAVWARFLWGTAAAFLSPQREQQAPSATVQEPEHAPVGALGRTYQDGETIVREGELGDCMYVVQHGQVEVIIASGDEQVRLNVLGENEFFGEMAIFEHEIRSATVRALGPARILTIDHENLMRRIHEDPSLAYRLMQVMSNRVRKLSGEVAQLRHAA